MFNAAFNRQKKLSIICMRRKTDADVDYLSVLFNVCVLRKGRIDGLNF